MISGLLNSNNLIKTRKSTVVILLFSFLVIFVFLGTGAYKEDHNPFISDGMGYYLYLPSIFIFNTNDVSFFYTDYFTEIWKQSNTTGFPGAITTTAANGHEVPKYPLGISILQLPFFFIAHVLTKITALPETGFSFWYKVMAQLSTLFYAIFGINSLLRLLSKYLTYKAALISIFIISISTNFFFFSSFRNTMAHVYLFALVAELMRLTYSFYEERNQFSIFIISLILGLIFVTRPIDVLVGLLFPLYGVKSFRDFNSRLVYFWSIRTRILFSCLLGAIPVILQLIYWKWCTDQWVYYSYGEESFFWSKPAVIEVLFSVHNGFLIYSPIMFFALVGLFSSRYRLNPFFISSIVIFSLYIYVVSAWWCWWYGGSMGMRPMIDIYPVLALPLGFFLERIFENRRVVIYGTLGVILFFTMLNLVQSFQISQAILVPHRGKWDHYFEVFGKLKLSPQERIEVKKKLTTPLLREYNPELQKAKDLLDEKSH